ncbi:MAG: hypothetical protein AB1716_24070, partial [Planctomycetota bacterium]
MKAQCAVLCIVAVVSGVAVAADRESAAPALGPEQVSDVAVAVGGTRGALDAGEECPAGSLCGQDRAGNTWFYSDAQFCSGGSCGRVRAEKYPPPGVTINRPIGGISWYGVYIDNQYDGCQKPRHLFRVRFYRDNGQNMPDPNGIVHDELLEVEGRDTGERIVFQGGTIAAGVWEFLAILGAPVNQPTGWFSLQGDSDPPLQCYHLWAPSNEGDGLVAQWWERPFGGVQYSTLTADLEYCFREAKYGACCHDCPPECVDHVPELICLQQGGRFAWNRECDTIYPPCGQARGACCRDDGSCAITTCRECETGCNGDCNCDGYVNFDDINEFVRILGGGTPCRFANADINDDGQVDFSDINPFVACLAAGGGRCG